MSFFSASAGAVKKLNDKLTTARANLLDNLSTILTHTGNLNTRLTADRAGYLDALDIGVPVQPRVAVFTSTGYWVVPNGVNSAIFTLLGGGSGATSGVAGAAGGVIYRMVQKVTPGNSILITIGAAGAGQVGTNTYAEAAAIGGATVVMNMAAFGGTTGGGGGYIGVGQNGRNASGINGATSGWGGGGAGKEVPVAEAGDNATGFAAGGGKGGSSGGITPTLYRGGNGSPGLCIIEY